MKKKSAPEQTREQLRGLIEGRLGTAPDRSGVVLLAARLILEEALEGRLATGLARNVTSGPMSKFSHYCLNAQSATT
jgi:hypothetical protein